MDFMGISVWIFDVLILQMLPLISAILLIVGLFGVFNRLPKGIDKASAAMGREFANAFRWRK
jgi:hypothetical protein